MKMVGNYKRKLFFILAIALFLFTVVLSSKDFASIWNDSPNPSLSIFRRFSYFGPWGDELEDLGPALIELDPLTLHIKDTDSFWEINRIFQRPFQNSVLELSGLGSASSPAIFILHTNSRFFTGTTIYSIDLITGNIRREFSLKTKAGGLAQSNDLFYISEENTIHGLGGESITLPEKIGGLDFVSDTNCLMAIAQYSSSPKVYEVPLNNTGNFAGTFFQAASIIEDQPSSQSNYSSLTYANILWKDHPRDVLYISRNDLSPDSLDKVLIIDLDAEEILYSVSPEESALVLYEPITLPNGMITDYLTWVNPQGVKYIDGRLFMICDLCCSPCKPSIEIEKLISVDGGNTFQDADSPPGPTITVGSDIYFKLVITNTGRFRLVDISLSDSQFPVDTCEVPDKLKPGESFECVIGPFPAEPGEQKNTSTVIGKCTEKGKLTFSDTDDAYYTGIEPGAYNFKKFINGQDAETLEEAIIVDPNQPLTFKYQVSNTGNIPITWTDLTDDVFGDLSNECRLPVIIQASESAFCEIIRKAGNFPNGKRDIGTSSVENLADQSDQAWYRTPLPQPAYRFEKLINGQDADTLEDAVIVEPNQPLTFRYEVTNIGNVPITWINLSDDVFGNLFSDCNLPVIIPVCDSAACEIIRPAGNFPNGKRDIGTASVEGLPDQIDQAWYRTPLPHPAYSFKKLINGQEANTLEDAVIAVPNHPLTFRYEVANIGGVPITWTDLTDDVFGDLTGECGLPITIPVCDTAACEIVRPAGNFPAGKRDIGVASVEGLPDQSDPAWYRTPAVEPDYSFLKFINGQDADTLEEAVIAEPNQPLVFKYQVTNTGNVQITWTSLTDDVFGDLSLDCSLPVTIPVGGSEFCEILRQAGNFPDGKRDIGTASVEGLPDQNNPAWYRTPSAQPAYTFEKLIDGEDADTLEEAVLVDPNQLLVFSYGLTNIGNVPITWTGLDDDVFGNLSAECGLPIIIPVGDSAVCEIVRRAERFPLGKQDIGTASVQGLPDQNDPAWYRTRYQVGDFCTYTQGGWGSPPSGQNPGAILANNFGTVYPSGVEVGIPGGSGFSMLFTAASAIEVYLPAGGPPGALTADHVDPTQTNSSGVFGGQVLALQINVDFSAAGIIQGAGGPVGDLQLCNTGTSLDGQTVAQILNVANIALGGGGLPAGFTFGSLNSLITNLNEAFDECTPNDFALNNLCPADPIPSVYPSIVEYWKIIALQNPGHVESMLPIRLGDPEGLYSEELTEAERIHEFLSIERSILDAGFRNRYIRKREGITVGNRNGITLLRAQLLACKLNLLRGCDNTTSVEEGVIIQDIIDKADLILANHHIRHWWWLRNSKKEKIKELTTILENYNRGQYNP